MKQFFMLCCVAFLFTQCSDDHLDTKESVQADQFNKKENLSLKERNAYLKEFSEILSKAIYNNPKLRGFLKDEALKKFDTDYDILYQLIKNKKVNEQTFREILVHSSSEERVSAIEESLPLLNILITNIDMFGIKPENLDTNDNDTPVIFARDEKNIYYLNGKEELITDKDEVPVFHAFVVNENSTIEQIIIPNKRNASLSARSSNTSNEPIIKFISPVYDNLHNNAKSLLSARSSSLSSRSAISNIVKQSYNHFNNSTSGGKNQVAFQRDYIYYGLTPNSKNKGYLNSSIREEINNLTIDPALYFRFKNDPRNPHITTNEFTVKRSAVSLEEQIRRMWSEGAYNFILYNFTSNDSKPEDIPFSLSPGDIWDLKIDYRKTRNGTLFRRSKHTYKIDPRKFTAKTIDFNQINKRVILEKWNWNLSKESLFRTIKLVQHNIQQEYNVIQENEEIRVVETNFDSGGAKLKLGLVDVADVNFDSPTAKTSESNTTKTKKTVTYKLSYGDIDLGSTKVYFYDPVVTDRQYTKYGYSLGSVQFTCTPTER